MSVIKIQGEKEKREQIYYEFDDEKNILGEGGMGVVYLGKRVAANGVQTKVAIKKLKIKDNDIIMRARREASIQLNHDNLVRMYGMIEIEPKDSLHTKDYYVISEYLEGVMLDDVIQGNLKNRDGVVYPSVAEFYEKYNDERNLTATYVVKCVLSGMMALHDAGYIHRDIDPTNIMLTKDGKVKLIDFGIAKKLMTLDTNDKGLTATGTFMGKAHYAAPELVLGDTRHQGFYTDVYAVGILYYQLVVGHLPFEGSTFDVTQMQLKENVPIKDISSWQIREIIRKATAKKQSDRYASSALFRAAIDNITYPEPRRLNTKLIGGVAVAALALLVFFFAFRGGQKAPDDVKIAAEDSLKMVFDNYLRLLNSSIPDSIRVGFEGMKQMAEENYPAAIHEVAMTYTFMIDEDKSDVIRKEALSLKLDNESAEQNREAVRWLERSVAASDSTDYVAVFYLCVYHDGEGAEGIAPLSLEKLLSMCNKAGEEAEKAGQKGIDFKNTYINRYHNFLIEELQKKNN